MSEWISVEDDLPEGHDDEDIHGGQLLICVESPGGSLYVSTGYIYLDQWYWWEKNKKISTDFKVIYWQPLPALPNQIKK